VEIICLFLEVEKLMDEESFPKIQIDISDETRKALADLDAKQKSIYGDLANQMKDLNKALSADFIIPNYAESVGQLSFRKENPAQWAFERLTKYIAEFEKNLDLDHEVGACLVSFGRESTFHISKIGYSGPDIIAFYGVMENGAHVQLIQNISQLNVLLIALPKIDENPRRIGFDLGDQEIVSGGK
jgi:hypothetical protein